ncbi:hypothetical protein BY458DRAFT_491906 [Sporodiniella umbellata]|nr:hypothetical protein BY458DRAFT_491906 [Sporodiniella umbellata]
MISHAINGKFKQTQLLGSTFCCQFFTGRITKGEHKRYERNGRISADSRITVWQKESLRKLKHVKLLNKEQVLSERHFCIFLFEQLEKLLLGFDEKDSNIKPNLFEIWSVSSSQVPKASSFSIQNFMTGFLSITNERFRSKVFNGPCHSVFRIKEYIMRLHGITDCEWYNQNNKQ